MAKDTVTGEYVNFMLASFPGSSPFHMKLSCNAKNAERTCELISYENCLGHVMGTEVM